MHPHRTAAAVVLLAAACGGPPPAEAPVPPEPGPAAGEPASSGPPQHVLLVTVDTMRADSLECTDDGSRITPHICALARQGRRYLHAVSPAPATLPALTAIFTDSQVANEEPATVVAHYDPLPTLAQDLRSRGLKTAAFTDHHGLGVSPANPVYPPALLQRGFDLFQNFGTDRRGQGARQVTQAAVDWLAEHGEEPYFLWVHYFDPHFNYRPDPALAARFGATEARCGRVENGMDIVDIRNMDPAPSPDEIACLKALHEAELHATDAAIGQLLAALPAAPRPLIIFASDHGEEFYDRNRIGHEWTLYNELIHVPFIVAGPGVEPGTESQVVSTRELHAVASGAPVEVGGTVYSRTSHYYGKSPLLSEVRQRANEHALVSDREKVVLHPDGRVERFVLRSDPGERQPSDVGGPLLDQLRSTMERLTVAPQAPSAVAAEQHRAAQERLKQLGYVE